MITEQTARFAEIKVQVERTRWGEVELRISDYDSGNYIYISGSLDELKELLAEIDADIAALEAGREQAGSTNRAL